MAEIELRDKFLIENEGNISNGIYEDGDVNKVRTDIAFVELYLRHLKGDMTKALKFMHTSLEWRKSFGVKDLSSASFLPAFPLANIIFFCNKDKNGHSILHIQFTKMKKEASYSDNAKKYLVWQLEKVFRSSPGQRIVVLMDMSGAGINNVDMNFIKFLISCFTSYFPCMLEYLLITDLPWILNAGWSVIKTWLSPEQQKFVLVVKKKDLSKYINPDQLFTHLDGHCELPTFPVMPARELVESGETAIESSTEESNTSTLSPVAPKRNSKSLGLTKQLSETSTNSLVESIEAHTPTPVYEGDQSKSTINNVTIYPPECITFERSDQFTDSGTFLTITNRSSCPAAYKVKTTSPDIFRVRPIMGIIQPNSYKKVSVTLISGRECNTIKDRFLVMLMMVRDETAARDEGNVGNLWRTHPRSPDCTEHRLSCRVSETQQNQTANRGIPNGGITSNETPYEEIIEQLKQINRNQMAIAVLLLVILLKVFIYPHWHL